MGYAWRGKEVIVGQFKACGITKLDVDRISFGPRGSANGSIEIFDHFEGCGMVRTWEAKRKKGEWIVRCTNKVWSQWLVEDDGYAAFTLEQTINKDMKDFIVSQLNALASHRAAA